MKKLKIKYPWKSREFKDFPVPVRETFIEISFSPFTVRVPLVDKVMYTFKKCAKCNKSFKWGYIPCMHDSLSGLFHFSCLDGLLEEKDNSSSLWPSTTADVDMRDKHGA